MGTKRAIQRGTVNGWEFGIKQTEEHFIKLLGKHVWQLDIAPDGKWEQRCRCGFYGVFNEHLTELIKGEK